MNNKKASKKDTMGKVTIKQTGAEKATQKTSKVELSDYLENVKKRAYEIFQKRGSSHGSDFEDWLKAEKEIKQRYGIK